MESKENIPSMPDEQSRQEQAEERDMASYYAAAASAANSDHVYQAGEPSSDAGRDAGEQHAESPSESAAEDGSETPPDDGAGSVDASIMAEGPHGPLPELSEDEPESESGLPSPSSHAAMESVHEELDPTIPPMGEEEDDDDDEEHEGAEDDVSMGILGHLGELRKRLMRIFIAVFLGWIALYGVAEILYGYLSAPLQACLPEGSKLIYTSPQGAFFTYLKVAFIASLFATSPFTFYQAWAFVAPGLYREEKRALLPLAFCSSFFFVGGAAFCFFLVFPIAFKFFMGFATDTIVPMISVEEYLSFALKLLIAFGLVFEMPLFSFFLSRFGILSPAFLRRSRRYAILIIFIVAAILTPPDVISQILMALPMIVLYELSIYVSATAYKQKNADKKQEEPQS